ncbi:helix-turn-helix transcriptional regulator [Clostridium botulinum]
MNQIAIIREVLSSYKVNIYNELYKDLPENTIGEKIIKLRYMHNIERSEFAKLLNFHLDTLESWELHNVMPKPNSIKKLCEFFNVSLEYFHNYYSIYFDNPGAKIKEWKENKDLTYKQACNLLNITHSGFGRLLHGKINLSYNMYLKLKKLGAF